MHTPSRSLFEFPVAALRAAALALLAAASTSACSAGPDNGAGVLADARSTASSTGSSPCAGVSLDASRTYWPRSWSDGRVALEGGALTFAIPARIPVTGGAAGDGQVRLTYRSGAGRPTTCLYRGQGARGRGGVEYIFQRCKAPRERADDRDDDEAGDDADRGAAGPAAGSTISADVFTLHVIDGDRRAGATVVHLDLPVDTAVCRGEANFHDRALAGLGGNGRACSDCHMDSQRFQLTPAAARARFEEMVRSGQDDPLFRPIDADDFRTNGAAAHDYTSLIENGLVRVTIPLPANVRLLDCGAAIPCPASALPTTETVADVWRAVPPILDVAITGPDGAGPVSARGPNTRGGYQLDARIDTLQAQALAALRGHAAVAADPQPSWLDDVAAFEQTQFSSAGVKELSDAMAAGTSPLPDPDPVLDALETQGRAVFDRSCAQCHGDQGGHPSGSTPIVQGTPGTPTSLIRYHTVTTACPRPVDTVSPPRFAFAPCSPSQLRNVRTYQITNSGVAPSGTACGGLAPQPPCVTRVTTSDPGRLLLTGYPVPGGPGDIEHLDTPSLRGISLTAPYFSNNTAETLEEVVEHYKQFFKRVAIQAPAAPLLTTQPGVVPPVQDRPFTDAEVAALLAYLRKI